MMGGDNIDEETLLVYDDGSVMNEKLLAEYTLEGKWSNVIKIYHKFPEAHTTTITNSVGTKTINEGTALHVAIELDEEEVVEKLLEIIIIMEREKEKTKKKKGALETVNESGDTPLHVAASRGFARMCRLIVGRENERVELVKVKNKEGETPLFLAALNWSKHAFAYLSHITRDTVQRDDLLRNNGDTILHCAIKREFFDLAVIIMHYYDFLSTHINKEGFTPLKVLATRPSAFISSTRLSWWMRILYYCILVEPLDVERTMKKLVEKIERQKPASNKEMKFPMNYATLCEFPKLFYVLAPFGSDEKMPAKTGEPVCLKKKGGDDDTENPPIKERIIYENGFLPPNYATSQQFISSVYVHALALTGLADLKELRKIKKKHQWSVQLLEALMQRPYASFTGGGGQPTDLDVDPAIYNVLSQMDLPGGGEMSDFGMEEPSSSTPRLQAVADSAIRGTPMTSLADSSEKLAASSDNLNETPFLLAARNGIVEMVRMILKRIPSAIHNTNAKKENVLLVAVINRQPLVVETLKSETREEVWTNLLLAADDDENTVLHLAAHALGEEKPWQIAGSALQMMWDIKWYEYIKSIVPQHFYFRSNKGTKTPGEIFKETHKKLVEESSTWLKDTSESCSVVAALVAGVSFATTSTVPGGTNDEGEPPLEGQPAFDAFAISSLIGLCFSVTGLIMFLAILTSRKEARDFRKGLPTKLLIGLSSLFVSIVAMFVSFCAGHFFIINHNYRRLLFPFYAATSVPVAFYAVAQFPLYLDLLKAILTTVPQASDKGDDL